MEHMVHVKHCAAPPLQRQEVLRYAQCRKADESVLALLDSCWEEVRHELSYRVCWRELPLRIEGEACDFDAFTLRSGQLAAHLQGCERVVLMAATVGVALDRLIAREGRLAPSRALMFQAIGAERIEALCDSFCRDLARARGLPLLPRFSPGYGDLPLTAQKDIFALLDCGKNIGLFLTDSLLMSPSKSVTAFVGLGAGEGRACINKCAACDNTDCAFRGAV